jgi:hypothetical protein
MTNKVLTIYVVYHNPTDYPGKFVVRGQSIVADDPHVHIDADPLTVATSLDDAREPLLGFGLYRMPRQRGDDPVIVETWI